MDTLRGQIGSFDEETREEDHGFEADGGDVAREAPPSPVGQDERRMQVRAYNHWASLLQDRNFPSIEDLDPAALPDFGPHSVLLDFTGGIENPAVQYLGEELARECGATGTLRSLDDVPSRSLLSRITDHYMQILANQAPIGFEAEFVNQRGASILYRGILLPFSSDDDSIDFIFGVINWKEVADQLAADELLLEIDQALETRASPELLPTDRNAAAGVADWADGPAVDEAPVEHAASGTSRADDEDEVDWGEDAPGEDAGAIAEFVLPDIGDADEEDTIDHNAYASLMPSGGDDEDEDGLASGSGLAGLRSKLTKKPLDLSLVQAIAPPTQGTNDAAADGHHDFPAPVFGHDDSRFASLLGHDPEPDDDTGDEDGDDGWGAPLDPGHPAASPEEEAAAPSAREALTEAAPLPGETAHDFALPTPLNALVGEAADETIPPSPAQHDDATGLFDTLAAARELARVAASSEDRSRAALYGAVGRAYDVSLAAAEAPDEFAELVAESGLAMQDRAPMTPVVKLVFGADYDKTRLTEYAAVLSHAHRRGIGRGGLRDFLMQAEGGLKGVVQAERRLRREEEGKPVEPANVLREALARKLRQLELHGFDAIDPEGPEFGVVVIRRLASGEIAVLGDCSDDLALVERAARKLIG